MKEISELKKLEGMIEKLAASVANGFAGLKKKFEAVDDHFGNIDNQLADMQGTINHLVNNVDRIESKMDAKFNFHERRISVLEAKMRK